MDFVPEESALAVETIEVDKDTMEMLKSLNMGNLPGVSVQHRTGGGGGNFNKGGGGGYQGNRGGGDRRN